MRKFVKKLIDRSECVLATGHSFLFVTDFEKKKYKELFGEFIFKEKEMKVGVSDIVFDSEWEEINALIKEGKVIFGYDDCLSDVEEYEKMKYKLAKKKEAENKLLSKSLPQASKENEEKFVSLYKKLDSESQMIILKLCEMLASRDG